MMKDYTVKSISGMKQGVPRKSITISYESTPELETVVTNFLHDFIDHVHQDTPKIVCQNCGREDFELEGHHTIKRTLVPYSKILWLCPVCHIKFESACDRYIKRFDQPASTYTLINNNVYPGMDDNRLAIFKQYGIKESLVQDFLDELSAWSKSGHISYMRTNSFGLSFKLYSV